MAREQPVCLDMTWNGSEHFIKDLAFSLKELAFWVHDSIYSDCWTVNTTVALLVCRRFRLILIDFCTNSSLAFYLDVTCLQRLQAFIFWGLGWFCSLILMLLNRYVNNITLIFMLLVSITFPSLIVGGLTVNSICSLWQLTGIWGCYRPPKISETTGRMTMKFLPDVKLSQEARNQKKFWHNLTGL